MMKKKFDHYNMRVILALAAGVILILSLLLTTVIPASRTEAPGKTPYTDTAIN